MVLGVRYLKRTLTPEWKVVVFVCLGLLWAVAGTYLRRQALQKKEEFLISKLKEATPNKVEDLAMVCANCHRMLHHKRPWPTIETLKSLHEKFKKEHMSS